MVPKWRAEVCLRSWYGADVPAPRSPQSPDEGPPSQAAARSHPNDPLHGLKLKDILTQLHARLGWHGLGQIIRIRCFTNDPSMSSSLAFLRRHPWARKELEELFLRSLAQVSPRPADAPEETACAREAELDPKPERRE